jgi:8-oxo-dGTP pyrophosphatase MutT (NUDIX family)
MTDIFFQAGAIPCRTTTDGLEIVLISTSSGKHWTIPKGVIEPGASAEETVHNETLEEAGIKGKLVVPSIGIYRFKKWGGICHVEVFVMMVKDLLDEWPEAAMRRRILLDCLQASRKVKHSELGQLILRAPAVAVCERE